MVRSLAACLPPGIEVSYVMRSVRSQCVVKKLNELAGVFFIRSLLWPFLFDALALVIDELRVMPFN